MVGSSLTSSQIFSSTSTNFTNPDFIIGIIESLINSAYAGIFICFSV